MFKPSEVEIVRWLLLPLQYLQPQLEVSPVGSWISQSACGVNSEGDLNFATVTGPDNDMNTGDRPHIHVLTHHKDIYHDAGSFRVPYYDRTYGIPLASL